MIHLHGITLAKAEVPRAAPRHRRMPLGAHLGIVTDVADAIDRKPSETEAAAAAMAHHRLLTSYCNLVDVLPVRYGTVFSSPVELAAEIDRACPVIAAGFDRVAGCVEYILGFQHRPGSGDGAASQSDAGRDFLNVKRARRDKRRRAARDRALFAASVFECASRVTKSCDSAPAMGQRALPTRALLVERAQVPCLVETLQAAAADASACGLAIRLVGPGPCYSFAQEWHG